MVLSAEQRRTRTLGSTMGCCSVTQRHTGIDEVGPDEIELLELSGDNLGVFSVGESRLQLSVRSREDEPPPSARPLEQEVVLWGRSREELHHRIYSPQPIRDWEGRPAHMYGEIVHSSLVSLFNNYTQPLSLDPDSSPHMLEISSPMMDSKVFNCHSAAELQRWMQHLEDRRFKSKTHISSPSHCALSYLLPCDEHWKREELKKYLLQAPIWQWEGSPIQHMGPPGFLSVVHIINSQRQGLHERLMVLFPEDVLLLSLDAKQLNLRYEGRLPRASIQALERSAVPGRFEFELMGELLEPLQVSCTCMEDYQNWIFHLQQVRTKSCLL
ncbi:rho guanine nucleotide exchange factor 7 isoform 4-T4 [Synchiropus picturatus]